MKLLENPDSVIPDIFSNKELNWPNSDAYAFGYHIGEFYIKKSVTHYSLTKIDRDYLDLPGRFWKNSKVITFWKNPNKFQLQQLIKDIYNETKIKITDDWLIEIDEREFQKVGEFLGHTRVNTDINQAHVLSPILKPKDRDKTYSGSNKYNDLARKTDYSTVAQMKNKLNMENLSLTGVLGSSDPFFGPNAPPDNPSLTEIANKLNEFSVIDQHAAKIDFSANGLFYQSAEFTRNLFKDSDLRSELALALSKLFKQLSGNETVIDLRNVIVKAINPEKFNEEI